MACCQVLNAKSCAYGFGARRTRKSLQRLIRPSWTHANPSKSGLSCVALRTTDAEVVREIDHLLDTYTDGEIADVLNERGVRTVVPTPWTRPRITRLRHAYGLTDRRTRLPWQGLLTPAAEAANRATTVRRQARGETPAPIEAWVRTRTRRAVSADPWAV